MMKKVLAFILTFAMVLSLAPVSIFANETNTAPTIFVGVTKETEVPAGTAYTFPVEIKNNSGFYYFALRYFVYCGDVDVTDKFTHGDTWATLGDIYGSTNCQLVAQGAENVVIGTLNGNTNLESNGTLYTMSLTPDANLVNSTYTIRISLDYQTDNDDNYIKDDVDPNNFSSLKPDGDYEAIATVQFPPTEFTLTGGIKESDVTPTVTIEGDTNYSYAATAPDPTALTANATVTTRETGSQLSYQWFKNGNEISGATSATYTPDSLPTISNSDTYKCEVTNTYNGVAYTGKAEAAVSYSKAEITGEQDISITAPMKGGTPQSTIQAGSDANYSGTITWNPAHSTFAANTAYTASVTLTAKENYQFASSVTAKVNGETVSEAQVVNDGDKFTFKAVFPATANKTLSQIEVTTPPTKTAYQYGDTLNTMGMVVTATYDDNTAAEVTNYTVKYANNGNYFAKGDTSVTVAYGGKEATVSGLTVTAKKITVKADDKTRAYGQANPDLTFTVPAGALVGSDTEDNLNVNLTCAATATSPVGTPVEITGTDSDANDNYEITVENGTLTITKAKVKSATFKDGAAALTVSKAEVEKAADAAGLEALGLPTLVTLSLEGDKPVNVDVNAAWNKTLNDIKKEAAAVDATSEDKTVEVTLTKDCFPPYAEAGSGLIMPKVTISITSKHKIPKEDITFENVATTYGTDAKVEATVTQNVDKYNGVTYTYTYQKEGGTATATKPTAAGKYTVTVTVENDNYKGSKTAALTIGQKAVTAAVTAENKVYDGAKTAAVKAEVNKAELVSGDSIEITGLTGAFSDANVGNGKKVTVDLSKKVISGKGSENYNITFDTDNVTANIMPKKITDGMIGSIADQAYTGSAITPAVVVKDGGKTLTKNVDYTVAYANNTDAGKASVTVAGKGNYTGEVTATFTITQKSINGATVAVAGGSVYTGSPIEPKVTVTLDGQKLDPSNYDAAYSKNTNAGEASVTVTGKGNYTGTATAAFTIAPKPIDDSATVAIEPIDSQTYTGSPITPAVVVKDGGKTLASGADYTAAYSKNTNAGEASVTVTGMGNYTGTATANFVIRPKALDPLSVTALLQSVENKTSVVDLNKLAPADHGGEIVYTMLPSDIDLVHAAAAIQDGKLTLTFQGEAPEAGDTEDLKIEASGMKNYEDLIITVTIQYTDKEVLALNVAPNGSLVYDGKAKDVAVTGAPAGVELEYSYSGVSAKGENYNGTTAPSNAGSYTATVTVKENEKYTGSAAANFTIKPAAATIKANDVSIFVGDALPTTYDVTVTPDGVTAEGLKATCPTGDGDTAGTYPIIVSGSSVSQDGNYNIAYENGALTVKNKAVATPEATPNGGSFTGSQQVTLTCDTPDAKIYYTTDGSEPTTNSTLYEAPFTLSASATVKAIAVKEGMENSPVLSVAFTKNSGGGDGGDGGSSSGGKTETTTESDGSVVTTTKNDDGSTTINTKKPDGTTSTEVKKPDGSSKTTTQTKDGSSSVVNIDADGKTTAEVTLSAAASDGKTAALPMPAVKASSDFAKAPAVTIKTAGNQPAKVEIPVSNGNAGTVAVLVQADGTEKIIKTSVLTENGLALAVNSGDQIKIVDNSKSFADTASHWGKDSIQFVTSRELFVGTSATEFSPDSTMTRGMLMTVLARFEDVNTSGGATWYEKGVSWAKNNSLSDGANPDANISREQLVTILYRYAASKNVAVGGGADMSAYHDAGQISEWAKDAMSWAVQNGIINGMDDGALAPAGNATRTQVAAVIERYAKLFMA